MWAGGLFGGEGVNMNDLFIHNTSLTTIHFTNCVAFECSYKDQSFFHVVKVEIILEQRYVAFLSPSKICENLNFSTEIQIFANFAG